MSCSTSSPAPASSPPSSTPFTAEMAGRRVELFLPWRQGILLELQRQEAQQATLVKIEVSGAFYPDRIRHLQTIGGLKFQGPVHMDEASTQASLLVRDDAVRSCRCCSDMDVPTPPFSSTIEGMAVRFSESEPHTFEATILTVEKQPTLSVVHLEPTSVPPYSACIGDRIMLRSGLITWEGTVIYFGDHQTPPDVTALENRICIHVLDQHVPQGPRCLPHPHCSVFVRPAQGPPANIAISHLGKGPQRKRKQKQIEAIQKKIKVAINGYSDIGRALARVALDSEDVELVAINDPTITDQLSCMFSDSKCDFEVKSESRNPGILSFGKKEVNFFEESDPGAVPWYMASTKLIVKSRNSSPEEEVSCREFAAEHGQDLDVNLSGPLEEMLHSCNPFCTTPNSSRFPILYIRPITPILYIRPITASDAKAVSDCFPLWRGNQAASVVRFQGVDVIFALGAYADYHQLPTSTLPSINMKQLVRWCLHMLSQTPAGLCNVEISKPSTYF
ncbi:uncharacterized protein [Lolium perenne]|uniref:uncharacterized protein isoform X2 n=1 Tax=Lolium perenne TaxID=4522 RepID=UPI0021F5C6F4|nr:uncharacterized protein LOC127293647 isoform X3 [Lolium perenne]